MYVKRIQIKNYGPLGDIDYTFSFDSDRPKPVLLVGGNGSGKSIVLSHIANGLIDAKGIAFPETPEVEQGKVYKLRSGLYIRRNCEFYFAQVDFANSFSVSEMRTSQPKQAYTDPPLGIEETDAEPIWHDMDAHKNDHYASTFHKDENKVKDEFSKNCILYFPFNRFEEPAWLNEGNLVSPIQHTDPEHLSGNTSRKIISHSPLRENRNWLFDIIYDRAAFEINTTQFRLPIQDSDTTIPLPVFLGYAGEAESMYTIVLELIRKLFGVDNIRFGIGRRNNRVISIESGNNQIVPNVFQLSSGETSLLNICLSILRDFDLTGSIASTKEDIKGVVLIDEIDVHLHAYQQAQILPTLLQTFPNVQFVITTHSPLFVLGMEKTFGNGGFDLYHLPEGRHITPEEFSEFTSSYSLLTDTDTHDHEIRKKISEALKPVLVLEGSTDVQYLTKAAELLGRESVLSYFAMLDGGGNSKLKKIWSGYNQHIPGLMDKTVVLLFDCECNRQPDNRDKLYQRTIPLVSSNPLNKGIENLFAEPILSRALDHKPSFFDITREHISVKRGVEQTVAEKLSINSNEKTNLCSWICESGTEADFAGFTVIFDMLEEIIEITS